MGSVACCPCSQPSRESRVTALVEAGWKAFRLRPVVGTCTGRERGAAVSDRGHGRLPVTIQPQPFSVPVQRSPPNRLDSVHESSDIWRFEFQLRAFISNQLASNAFRLNFHSCHDEPRLHPKSEHPCRCIASIPVIIQLGSLAEACWPHPGALEVRLERRCLAANRPCRDSRTL